MSTAVLLVSGRWGRGRDEGGVLARLLRQSVRPAMAAVLWVALSEFLSNALASRGLHLPAQLERALSTSAYEGFAAAAVGVQAVFLALFFTTVGVIASTAYANVPGEIRQLFVQEPTSRLYVNNIVRGLVFGIVLLATPSIGYAPHRLTVAVFALLTVFSVVSLAVLGTGLFNFFDLSSLATPLPRRFARAANAVTIAGRRIPDEVRQAAANTQAAEVLRMYAELGALLLQRAGGEARAPLRLTYQLLTLWAKYTGTKPAIPTKSQWFARVASYPNWLTAEFHTLSLAIQTRTGLQADLAPDPMWVERELVTRLDELLSLLLSEDSWPAAIGVIDQATGLVHALAARLYMDEAVLLRQALARAMRPSYDPGSLGLRTTNRGPVQDPPTESGLALAAAEREVLTVTHLWLGVVAAARQFLDRDRLRAAWDSAVDSPTAPYHADAPRRLLDVLEQIASGIDFERRTEHRRVTPAWWVHHYCARALSRSLQDAARAVFAEVDAGVVGPLEHTPSGDEEVIAIRVFAALELTHKLGALLPIVAEATYVLEGFNHPAVEEDQWPPRADLHHLPAELEARLMRCLAKLVVKLPSAKHDASRVDFFGRAYKVLFDATFQALLDGQHELASALFPTVLYAADRARSRLADDLENERVREKVVFGTEPLVDLMELSGYALLMQELDGTGTWDRIREIWDGLVAERGQELVGNLTGILSAREGIFGLTSGGIERTNRRMQLTRLLRDRGIFEEEPFLSGVTGMERQPPHASPIVVAFAPDDMGGFGDLESLFVAEYLLKRPEAAGVETSRRVSALRESIELARDRIARSPLAHSAGPQEPRSALQSDEEPAT